MIKKSSRRTLALELPETLLKPGQSSSVMINDVPDEVKATVGDMVRDFEADLRVLDTMVNAGGTGTTVEIKTHQDSLKWDCLLLRYDCTNPNEQQVILLR